MPLGRGARRPVGPPVGECVCVETQVLGDGARTPASSGPEFLSFLSPQEGGVGARDAGVMARETLWGRGDSSAPWLVADAAPCGVRSALRSSAQARVPGTGGSWGQRLPRPAASVQGFDESGADETKTHGEGGSGAPTRPDGWEWVGKVRLRFSPSPEVGNRSFSPPFPNTESCVYPQTQPRAHGRDGHSCPPLWKCVSQNPGPPTLAVPADAAGRARGGLPALLLGRNCAA